MTQTRFYSSTSGAMTLTGSITSGATSLTVDTAAGLPASTPFTIIIDPGLASMEICDVTAVGGTTLTVTRGRDGTSAQAHDNGATVRHGFSARDFDESRAHEDDTTAHGATGAVVGTTNTQALTNKDLTSVTNTFPSTLALDADLDTHVADTTAHGTTGNVVGTSDTQTLTNKTISGSSNTLSNIAQSSVTSLTTDLTAIDGRLDALETADTALDGRLDDLEADSGELTDQLTAASNWTIAEQRLRRIGNVVILTFTATRTTSTLSSSASGNITNVSVATLASGHRPVIDEVGVSPRSTGTSWNGYLSSGGTMAIANLPPNVNLGVGDQISGSFTYLSIE
jgi:hypothetical protein